MVATLPTQYPSPVSSGGLAHASHVRPLRGPPAAFVRQPFLGSPPMVAGLVGFGAGSGAFIRNDGSDADQSQGLVVIRCGLNPLGVGVVQLTFPLGIVTGQYVALADWMTVSTYTIATPIWQVNWSANRTLLSNEVLLMAYQWTVSQ
jgi:hypothetical protein